MKSIKQLLLLAIIPIVCLGCSKPDDTGTAPKDDDPPTEEISLPYFTDFKDAVLKDDGAYFQSKGIRFSMGKLRDMSTLQWLDCVIHDGTITVSNISYNNGLSISYSSPSQAGVIANLSSLSNINKISVRIADNCGAPQCTRISTCDANGLVAEVYHSAINHDTTLVLDIGNKKLSNFYIGYGEALIKSILIE